MASVSSLDKDLRKLRLDKYTPQSASEARSWIESTLGERLPGGDLLESLKDGVALCKLVNMAVGPPGVRYKQSSMPFVQMENISLFLKACKAPPLNLQEHDVFLTVDLYESKDPAQVLQCLGAFSRAANAANPSAFPNPIGFKSSRGGVMSPQSTGGPASPLRGRGLSNASNASSSTIGLGPRNSFTSSKTGDSGSGRWSPTKSPTKNGSTSPTVVSSWSKKEHEGATSPAWNIAQYGYMGGASQGNLGISFGGRRQITSAGPHVPSLTERERKRREKEAEEERLRLEQEEEERRRKAEIEAEEERARLREERRWEEETRRLREEELRRQEEEKRRWEEEERQWKLTEERRRREEEEAEARIEEERRRARSRSREPKLQGQYLSQYQTEHGIGSNGSSGSKYSSRVRELEKELELARQREAEYQARRQKPGDRSPSKSRARSRSRHRLPARMDSWSKDEREVLRTPRHASPEDKEFQFQTVQQALPPKSPRPLPDPTIASPPPRLEAQRTGGGRPLPDPATASSSKVRNHYTGSRPLPEAPAPQPPPRQIPSPQPPRQIPSPQPPPRQIPSPQPPPRQEIIAPRPKPLAAVNWPSRFLASSPAPATSSPAPTYGSDLGFGAEQDAEDRRRKESQAKSKASGLASKSLLEREMEMERQRQQEWEEAQKETASRARPTDGAVDGVGGRWDVSQWTGFTGGDSQNRGSQGIGAGRRQVAGPRPLPGQR